MLLRALCPIARVADAKGREWVCGAVLCCAVACDAFAMTDHRRTGMNHVAYTDAVIVLPENDAAVRANAGNLVVRGKVSPKLRNGHRLQLLLDGLPLGKARRTPEFSLENIDRGTHRLQIRIVDETGNAVFDGTPSAFHLLRHSRLHP